MLVGEGFGDGLHHQLFLAWRFGAVEALLACRTNDFKVSKQDNNWLIDWILLPRPPPGPPPPPVSSWGPA